MATTTKDLGVATAYGYAVAGGYTGTEEEFAELMVSYASVAQEAEESAEIAEAYAKGTVDGTPVGSGETGYHDNAKYYAEQASGSATNAGNSADAASGSASGASASALKSEGHAVGQQNGSDVGDGSPYYHNNAKYYKEQASGSAAAASGSAGTAAEQALVSEGYAKGTQSGTPVASGTYYHDNAKYYKEQADGDASSASASATAANTDALKAEGYAVGKQNGTDVGSGSPYYENNAKYYASEAADSATEAAASAASIDPDTLAKVDGYYESMTVGNAEQLVATVGVEDSVPFNFRTTGGSADVGDRKTMEVVGGTVAFNQLFIGTAGGGNGTTLTVDATTQTLTVSGTATSTTYVRQDNIRKSVAGHKYFASIDTDDDNIMFYNDSAGVQVKGSTPKVVGAATAERYWYLRFAKDAVFGDGETFTVQLIDLTQMFGATIADYIYSLEQANAGAGVAWFKKLFPKPYYAYNAGELMSVKTSAYKSVGFNQWDEEWELGYIGSNGNKMPSSTCIRSKNYIPVCPNTAYYYKAPNAITIHYYDADKVHISAISSGTPVRTTPENAAFVLFYAPDAYGNTYNYDICINLSWDGERDGEYEPYEVHTYPLDSDLELRGIPKLDADNQLYYDGDKYESDGAVTRRYGVIDLGTLTWTKWANNFHGFYAGFPSGARPIGIAGGGIANAICSKYVGSQYSDAVNGTVDKCYNIANTTKLIYLNDSTLQEDTAEEFKTAMSGIYLVYELETSTTETADPFQTPQIVNDFGTEEFVDTRTIPIPVGHNSKYQANLRAKLEMAPDSPSDGDGDYIVRQTSGQNEYAKLVIPTELPTFPTTGGNYHLKCTVSSGTATLTWEADT